MSRPEDDQMNHLLLINKAVHREMVGIAATQGLSPVSVVYERAAKAYINQFRKSQAAKQDFKP